jgi:hypothetical protein
MPNGRKLLTLGDAGHYVAALPQPTQQRPEWRAASSERRHDQMSGNESSGQDVRSTGPSLAVNYMAARR